MGILDETTEKNPPLGDVSESEIASLVDDVLKTGKNLSLPPTGHKDGADAERLHARVIAQQIQQLATQLASDAPAADGAEERDEWWFEVTGKRLGPISLRKIRYLWEEGELTPDSLCWREGFTSWVSLFRISELATALAPKRVVPANLREVTAQLVRAEPPPAPGWQPSAGAALEREAKERLEAASRPPPPPQPLSAPIDPVEQVAGEFRPLAVEPPEPPPPVPQKKGFSLGGAVVSGLVAGIVVTGALVGLRVFSPPSAAPPVPVAVATPPVVPAPAAVAVAPPLPVPPPAVVAVAPKPVATAPQSHPNVQRSAVRNKPATVEDQFAQEFSSGHQPVELTTSQIMQVVLSHKPAVTACIQKQHAADADSTGRLVMRWTVHTNGKVSDVSVKTDEFADTPLATCLLGEIERWTFPEHDVEHGTVEIPFSF